MDVQAASPLEEMKSTIELGDERVKQELEDLKKFKTESKRLYKWIKDAFEKLEENGFAGIQIQKRLIPKEYETRFGPIHNLWKYNLPEGWRLIYTVKKEGIVVLSIVLEWLKHKDYERRFNY